MAKNRTDNKLSVKEKVEHQLDELRVVLPGTQVLLGFQLTAFFSSGFDKLTTPLKNLHLISLGFVTLSIILLMTPVAFHQIVEKGEDTERFYRLAGKILVFALFFLGLGLTADIYVVTKITTQSQAISLLFSSTVLLLICALWFGYTAFKRKK
jgi:phosphate starvation-inducible membrane PsiE